MAHDSPRRPRLAIAICVVTVLYWLGIFALTHSPVVPMPKAEHAKEWCSKHGNGLSSETVAELIGAGSGAEHESRDQRWV